MLPRWGHGGRRAAPHKHRPRVRVVHRAGGGAGEPVSLMSATSAHHQRIDVIQYPEQSSSLPPQLWGARVL